MDPGYRPKAYSFIQKQVEMGHQAYIICPMVEASEMIEAENVLDYTKSLRTELPSQIAVEYLHGKMKAKEKKCNHGTVCSRRDTGTGIHHGH